MRSANAKAAETAGHLEGQRCATQHCAPCTCTFLLPIQLAAARGRLREEHDFALMDFDGSIHNECIYCHISVPFQTEHPSGPCAEPITGALAFDLLVQIIDMAHQHEVVVVWNRPLDFDNLPGRLYQCLVPRLDDGSAFAGEDWQAEEAVARLYIKLWESGLIEEGE